MGSPGPWQRRPSACLHLQSTRGASRVTCTCNVLAHTHRHHTHHVCTHLTHPITHPTTMCVHVYTKHTTHTHITRVSFQYAHPDITQCVQMPHAVYCSLHSYTCHTAHPTTMCEHAYTQHSTQQTSHTTQLSFMYTHTAHMLHSTAMAAVHSNTPTHTRRSQWPDPSLILTLPRIPHGTKGQTPY